MAEQTFRISGQTSGKATEESTSMLIRYWGVRGSIPSPLNTKYVRQKEEALIRKIIEDGGTQKLFGDTNVGDAYNLEQVQEKIRQYLAGLPLSLSGTYGGDTTCLEVQVKDSPLIVIDAGTGARLLGGMLSRLIFEGKNINPLNSDEATKRHIHLLFTHYHWDHIQGFPFFGPGFIPGDKNIKVHFYGKRDARKRLSEVLVGQQQYPNFPVEWIDMPCEKEYTELPRLDPRMIQIGNAVITYQELTHPDSVFAYAVEIDGKKFVCASDTEHKDSPDPRLVRLARNADILYYDAQYTPEEYIGTPGTLTGPVPKFDWGHSTYEWGIRNALAANVATLVLGHIEPMRDDFLIERLYERALDFKDAQLKLLENNGKRLEVVMAHQGLEQRL